VPRVEAASVRVAGGKAQHGNPAVPALRKYNNGPVITKKSIMI
jgi:hypothetical protein